MDEQKSNELKVSVSETSTGDQNSGEKSRALIPSTIRNKLYPAFLIVWAPDFPWHESRIKAAVELVDQACRLLDFVPEASGLCLRLKDLVAKHPKLSREEVRDAEELIRRIRTGMVDVNAF